MTAKKKTRRKTSSSNGHVDAGTLTIVVRGGELDGETIAMDVLVVRMAAQRLEDKHKMAPNELGLLEATPEFAIELDAQLKQLGYRTTPTIAMHAWERANAYFAEQQKKTS